jgi:hypothetical protein
MKDHLHALHAVPYASTIRYRADMRGERGLKDIEADDLASRFCQGANQGFAKMTGASCNQDLHAYFACDAGMVSNVSSRALHGKQKRGAVPAGRAHQVEDDRLALTCSLRYRRKFAENGAIMMPSGDRNTGDHAQTKG